MTTKLILPTLPCLAFLFATSIADAQVKQTTTTFAATTPTAMAPASVGQAITLDGMAFKVNYSKQLAKGVEYYSLKPADTQAAEVNYLRTKDTYNPTVFAQAQYEAFIKTGKLSVFGTLKEMVLDDGTKVNYVTRDATSAYLYDFGKDLLITEVTIMAKPEGPKDPPTGGGGDKPVNCAEKCKKEPCSKSGSMADQVYCEKLKTTALASCIAQCNVKARTTVSMQVLSSSVTVKVQ